MGHVRNRPRRRTRTVRRMAKARPYIMVCAMAAPLAAQLMMVIVMMVQGQWMYALMILPGAFGCLASLLIASPSFRQHVDTATDSPPMIGPGTHLPTEGSDTRIPAKPQATPVIPVFPDIDGIALEQLLDLGTSPWRTMVHRWLASAHWNVPIGTTTGDEPYHLDLCRSGPHALVAGTTGSGKSVLLQSWCLALAAHNGPDRLNFVFLDFKGGSAFRDLEQLPHSVGSVCDLNLPHAARALRALEAELTRRERLTAEYRTSHIDDVPHPPPRLMVVIDEFHALKDQLPDYINRLVRIASLGRSLGMHLIACTQNPLGQVSTDMKANMAVNICLRVRDDMQSSELLGDGRAARISPTMPGAAYCNDSERVTALRCSPANSLTRIRRQILLAARFMGMDRAPALFSAPLPSRISPNRPSAFKSDQEHVWFGIQDDGISLSDALVTLNRGNIGIIGGHGRGKSTLLDVLAVQCQSIDGIMIRISRCEHGVWSTRAIRHAGVISHALADAPAPEPPRMIWLVDDSDALFDPFLAEEQALRFRQALADPNITVLFTASSMRHIRIPEHCSIRIVFPSGEKTNDMMTGIPSPLLETMTQRDIDTPGRAVLITGSSARLVQCSS